MFTPCSMNVVDKDKISHSDSICHYFAVKPFLIRGPQNQTAVVGNSVTFQCRVGGEPIPDVLWRRTASGGNMPLGE